MGDFYTHVVAIDDDSIGTAPESTGVRRVGDSVSSFLQVESGASRRVTDARRGGFTDGEIHKVACSLCSMSRGSRRASLAKMSAPLRRRLLAEGKRIQSVVADSFIEYTPEVCWAINDIIENDSSAGYDILKSKYRSLPPEVKTFYDEFLKNRYSPAAVRAQEMLGPYRLVQDDARVEAFLEGGSAQEGALDDVVEAASVSGEELYDTTQEKLDELGERAQSAAMTFIEEVSNIYEEGIADVVSAQTLATAEEATEDVLAAPVPEEDVAALPDPNVDDVDAGASSEVQDSASSSSKPVADDDEEDDDSVLSDNVHTLEVFFRSDLEKSFSDSDLAANFGLSVAVERKFFDLVSGVYRFFESLSAIDASKFSVKDVSWRCFEILTNVQGSFVTTGYGFRLGDDLVELQLFPNDRLSSLTYKAEGSRAKIPNLYFASLDTTNTIRTALLKVLDDVGLDADEASLLKSSARDLLSSVVSDSDLSPSPATSSIQAAPVVEGASSQAVPSVPVNVGTAVQVSYLGNVYSGVITSVGNGVAVIEGLPFEYFSLRQAEGAFTGSDDDVTFALADVIPVQIIEETSVAPSTNDAEVIMASEDVVEGDDAPASAPDAIPVMEDEIIEDSASEESSKLMGRILNAYLDRGAADEFDVYLTDDKSGGPRLHIECDDDSLHASIFYRGNRGWNKVYTFESDDAAIEAVEELTDDVLAKLPGVMAEPVDASALLFDSVRDDVDPAVVSEFESVVGPEILDDVAPLIHVVHTTEDDVVRRSVWSSLKSIAEDIILDFGDTLNGLSVGDILSIFNSHKFSMPWGTVVDSVVSDAAVNFTVDQIMTALRNEVDIANADDSVSIVFDDGDGLGDVFVFTTPSGSVVVDAAEAVAYLSDHLAEFKDAISNSYDDISKALASAGFPTGEVPVEDAEGDVSTEVVVEDAPHAVGESSDPAAIAWDAVALVLKDWGLANCFTLAQMPDQTHLVSAAEALASALSSDTRLETRLDASVPRILCKDQRFIDIKADGVYVGTTLFVYQTADDAIVTFASSMSNAAVQLAHKIYDTAVAAVAAEAAKAEAEAEVANELSEEEEIALLQDSLETVRSKADWKDRPWAQHASFLQKYPRLRMVIDDESILSDAAKQEVLRSIENEISEALKSKNILIEDSASLAIDPDKVKDSAPNTLDIPHTASTYHRVRNTRKVLDSVLSVASEIMGERISAANYKSLCKSSSKAAKAKVQRVVDTAVVMNELDLICPDLYKRKLTDSYWVCDNASHVSDSFKLDAAFAAGHGCLVSNAPLDADVVADREVSSFKLKNGSELHVVLI